MVKMHSPLRSEADAFKWVVVSGIAGLSVVAVTLLTRPAVGAAWLAALVGFGCGVAYRNSRGSIRKAVEVARGRDDRHRVLVVANETVGGGALLEEIRNRTRGRQSEVLV